MQQQTKTKIVQNFENFLFECTLFHMDYKCQPILNTYLLRIITL